MSALPHSESETNMILSLTFSLLRIYPTPMVGQDQKERLADHPKTCGREV